MCVWRRSLFIKKSKEIGLCPGEQLGCGPVFLFCFVFLSFDSIMFLVITGIEPSDEQELKKTLTRKGNDEPPAPPPPGVGGRSTDPSCLRFCPEQTQLVAQAQLIEFG